MRSITIVASDLDTNALQRAHTFAHILAPAFRVHVVGYTPSGEIWQPLRSDSSVEYRPLAFRSALSPHLLSRKVLRTLIEGDVVIAHKAVNTSFGLALRIRRLLNLPFLLDLDEWELGLIGSSVYWEFRRAPTRWFLQPNSPLYTRLLDRRIRTADALTVTNSFLQGRYGGTVIPHARDESTFKPRPHDVTGSPGKTVLFLGSIRPNKGLDVLLDAWPLVGVEGSTLSIIGTPLDDPRVIALRARAGETVRFEGHVSHEHVPRLMGDADVFVIPQLPSPASSGQLPTKLIEAMAMGLPIVASAVADIPQWLSDGAGLLVNPGDPRALAQAIRTLLRDPPLARSCGEKARSRFLREASFASVRPRLVELLDAMIAGRSPSLKSRPSSSPLE